MKIAFDGTVLHGQKSGVGYYCEELLKALLPASAMHQFFVFSHRPLNSDYHSPHGNIVFSNSHFCPIRAFYLHALLPKMLDRSEPDLCHFTNFLAPISARRPYVVTIHDMGLEVLRDSHPWAKRLYTKRLIPHVAKRARLIITNSEYSKWQIVRHLGISEDRIRVTPLAPSPEMRPVAVTAKDPYFLYVGNLEPRKNLARLIEAFARMHSKEYQLIIAGARWYRGTKAEESARQFGVYERVKFLGYVPRAELPALYSGATAVVYPSLLEGFGLPVVEAMACGTPVITSNNSALREIGSDAAVLIDPLNVREITETMTQVAEDPVLRSDLSQRGLLRAAEFSWTTTANLTLDVYEEAIEASVPSRHTSPARSNLQDAIHRTIEYANLFSYPLTEQELRERLFDVEVDETTFQHAIMRMPIRPDAALLSLRRLREKLSDVAIQQASPYLRTLASIPFVRMLAFSGATAHRNMTDAEDIDLFMIVEDGKLWAVFLICMLWAKVRGLRKRLCLNYVISDAALPVFEHDAFTAQQIASLKPIYGKKIYDLFLRMNPFVKRHFPNFQIRRHRELYDEIEVRSGKRLLETILRLGPIQVLEGFSRYVLGRYLGMKLRQTSADDHPDVLLEPRRLKLHMKSHKSSVLRTVEAALDKSYMVGAHRAPLQSQAPEL